jgi:L-ascorbate metabolism protein UlaG (beta-lactamase superfamily)
LSIRWLGTAGFVLESDGGAIAIDPYVTRAGLRELATSRLVPNEAELRARLPRTLGAVVCGHSHFDHLLDAPLAARLSGAKLIGSRTTCAFGRGNGVPAANLVEVGAAGGALRVPEFEIELVPSLHARLALGRVPFPGEVSGRAPAPARAWEYRMGGAFGVFVRASGVSVYHNGSADLVDARLDGRRADVAIVGLAGRQATPNYLERLLSVLRPTVVIPAHHDAFFAPLRAGVRLLPGIDFDGFVTDVRRIVPRAQVIAPFYDEPVWIAPGGTNAFLL